MYYKNKWYLQSSYFHCQILYYAAKAEHTEYLIGTFVIQQLASIDTNETTRWDVIQTTQAPTSV